jgi:hypothetical protein
VNSNATWLDNPKVIQRILFEQSLHQGRNENLDSTEKIIRSPKNDKTVSALGRISEDIGEIKIERD